jgi:hypothetical protein
VTEPDSTLGTVLGALVPSYEGRSGDWELVLRTAAVETRRTRSRRLVVAVVVLAAFGLLASPAFGLGSRLWEFLGFSAPPAVKSAVVGFGAPDPATVSWMRGQGFGIEPGKVRGVVELRTPAGTIRLWVAPTKRGICRFVEILQPGSSRPSGPVACVGPPSRYTRLDAALESTRDWPSLARPILHGHVYSPVVRVRLDFTDGTSEQIRPVEGFFLVAVPPGKQALDVVGLDTAGRVIVGHPLIYKPPPQPVFHRLFSLRTRAGIVTLEVNPVRARPRCFEVVAVNGSTSSCDATPVSDPVDPPMFQQVGPGASVGPRTMVVMAGHAHAGVRSITLVVSGGAKIPVPLHDSFFMVPLRPDQRPVRLLVETAHGPWSMHLP